ncbi:MAG: hypothetical protein IKP86_14280, partial [Anaerolineaceae bacterium]|nr:hypothetical protein [Anaerolineaceae bacterium]
ILTGERRPMNGIYWVKVIVNDGKGLTGWMRESAIVISQAIEAGNTFTFGSYEQDNNTENSSESIEWLVLEVEDENMLVISKYGLEIISGTGTDSEIKGSFSAVSEWLNEDFYNSAFNDYERARILPAEGSDDTFLYLLSSSDMEKYFPTQESQICELTAHAAANIGNDDEGSLKWWKPDDDDGTSAEKVVARPVFRMDISDLTNSGNIILATPTADPILTLTPIKVPDLVFTPPAGEESEETTDSPGQPKEDTSTSEDICPDEPEIPDIIQPVIEH